MSSFVFAGVTDGAFNLWWLYLWLLSAFLASTVSVRKGYSDRAGLATGLVLSIIGLIIWLIVPAKPDSRWKTLGPMGRGKRIERT